MKNKEEIRKQIKALAEEYISCLKEEHKNKDKDYIPASGKNIGLEELCNMLDASLDMWLTAGRFNDLFEEKFAEKLGVNFTLTTNSGSSANLLAFSALTSYKLKDRALKKGDEVISVAAGFPTTINPIIQNGLIPVFVDNEIGSYNIDTSKIEEAITPKTKAIFLAHTLGNMYDIEKILEIAKKYNLWVIEDSCDALGAKWSGKYAGTFGHIGTFSFYPAHHLTMGEGGAVVTNDQTLYKILLSFRDWGRDCFCKPGRDNTCGNRFNIKRGSLPLGYDHKYTYSHIGYNLKITDWQASIGLAQLDKLDDFLEIRKRNASRLLERLQKFSNIFILPKTDIKCDNAWFGFILSIKEGANFTKHELVQYLEDNGIGTRNLFAGNILRQPMFVYNTIPLRIGNSEIKFSNNLTEDDYKKLPNADFIMNNSFWVGVAQCNEEKDMDIIADKISSFILAREKIA